MHKGEGNSGYGVEKLYRMGRREKGIRGRRRGGCQTNVKLFHMHPRKLREVLAHTCLQAESFDDTDRQYTLSIDA